MAKGFFRYSHLRSSTVIPPMAQAAEVIAVQTAIIKVFRNIIRI
jgi:hypothetical protein